MVITYKEYNENIIDAYCEGLNLKAIFDFVDNMMKLEKLDKGSKW